jgi:hypothetical protein
LADAVYQEALAQAADAGSVVRAVLFRQVAFGFEVRQDCPGLRRTIRTS